MSEKWSKCLPYVFVGLAALSRWPNLFPPNFSVFYGLAFCAGAFFPRGAKWWMPLGTLVLTDIVLNLYYWVHLHINGFTPGQLVNYAGFAGIIWFGGRFSRRSSFLSLLAGGHHRRHFLLLHYQHRRLAGQPRIHQRPRQAGLSP